MAPQTTKSDPFPGTNFQTLSPVTLGKLNVFYCYTSPSLSCCLSHTENHNSRFYQGKCFQWQHFLSMKIKPELCQLIFHFDKFFPFLLTSPIKLFWCSPHASVSQGQGFPLKCESLGSYYIPCLLLAVLPAFTAHFLQCRILKILIYFWKIHKTLEFAHCILSEAHSQVQNFLILLDVCKVEPGSRGKCIGKMTLPWYYPPILLINTSFSIAHPVFCMNHRNSAQVAMENIISESCMFITGIYNGFHWRTPYHPSSKVLIPLFCRT